MTVARSERPGIGLWREDDNLSDHIGQILKASANEIRPEWDKPLAPSQGLGPGEMGGVQAARANVKDQLCTAGVIHRRASAGEERRTAVAPEAEPRTARTIPVMSIS